MTVSLDAWPRLSKRNRNSAAKAAAAQTIVAEWVRPSTVWLAKRKQPDQWLVVRLHRYELDSPYPKAVSIDKVDAVVYIAPLIGRRVQAELGWPADKLLYIPNYVDIGWLDRPKLDGARFTLGLIGMVPRRKRLDLALDLLAALRKEDPRFTLAVRSAMPWDNEYVWRRPEERAYVSWCFERVERDPLLRTSVTFHPPGRDMARWLRQVGHIVSTSDDEGSHTAIAEGMASGAVPAIRPWAGAADVYGAEWLASSLEQATSAVLENVDADVWLARATRAKTEVRQTHDPVAVQNAWADLLLGDIGAARSHFAAYGRLAP